jgi:MFS family permease
MLMGLSFALFVHFAAFLVELGADEVRIGLVIGVGSIGSLILRPFVGVLMDRIGRRPLIHAGNIINVLSAGLYLTVDSLSWWVYALTIVHGMAEAVLFTALATYGADIIPEDRRTEGLALFGVSGQLPIALGGLIGDFGHRLRGAGTDRSIAAP